MLPTVHHRARPRFQQASGTIHRMPPAPTHTSIPTSNPSSPFIPHPQFPSPRQTARTALASQHSRYRCTCERSAGQMLIPRWIAMVKREGCGPGRETWAAFVHLFHTSASHSHWASYCMRCCCSPWHPTAWSESRPNRGSSAAKIAIGRKFVISVAKNLSLVCSLFVPFDRLIAPSVG